MDILYLIKIGEILLKLGNRREFEERLKAQLKHRLGGIPHRVEVYPGRYFLYLPEGSEAAAKFVLSRTPGVNGYARAIKTEKTVEKVIEAAIKTASGFVEAGKRSFKAESRRSDKSFPLGSFDLSARIGESLLDAYPGLRVDLHAPDFTIYAEIREKAYIYGDPEPGLRGLPSGSAGKGLLLLSGGIDSPVAGYLMARRGLALEALYFHAYPYTSREAHEKVLSLARLIAGFTGGLRLWTIPFTDVQLKIRKEAREDRTTIMTRAAMMRVAQTLAEREGCNCLVTGESLGQVASQTAENLRFTQSVTDFPVLRPLIGLDKEETIDIAKRIGSYPISILPYEDCCVIFSPPHPLLRAELQREGAAYDALGLDPFLETAVAGAEHADLPFSIS